MLRWFINAVRFVLTRPSRWPVNVVKRISIIALFCCLPVGCRQHADDSKSSPSAKNDTSSETVVAAESTQRGSSQGQPPRQQLTKGHPASATLALDDTLPSGYVGTSTCAECHREQHASYLKTHHSRSLSVIDASSDRSIGAILDHSVSARAYDVVQASGELWHREWKRFGARDQDRVQVNQFPVGYVMGSGAFAHGYLLSDGEYLLQSPVTWYRGKDQFAMAPGYDKQNHLAMTRLINDECLFCHTGSTSLRDENPHKPVIHELAIGCERCHGPGQEHTSLYRGLGEDGLSKIADSKIVNPATLSRRAKESICEQCHIQSDLDILHPGRSTWDFRPGEDLAETVVNYKRAESKEFDKVFTGHTDQLWRSPCYQQSETLTCITCHDPHHSETITDRVAFRRDQCNTCHAEQGCALPITQRQQQHGNDCVSCHMPTIGSEVPHTSTTSHTIAIYRDGKPQNLSDVPDQPLRRLQQNSTLSESELQRYDQLAQMFNAIDQAVLGKIEALEDFPAQSVVQSLLGDPQGDAVIYALLARKARMEAENMNPQQIGESVIRERWQQAAEFAKKTLRLESRPVTSRESALEVLAMQLMAVDQHEQAIEPLAELTQIRRTASDHYNLGLSLAHTGRISDAEQSLRAAIRLDGSYAPPYRSLSVIYRNVDPNISRQFAEMMQRLSQPIPPNESSRGQ